MSYLRTLTPFLLFLFVLSQSVSAQTSTPKQREVDYINKYKYLAIEEMERAGIPASITLAQGILESASGTSRLATNGNNHFGIKCHKGWTGGRMYHDDDAKGECFRTYVNAETSFRDHSDFLTGRSRYSDLFTLWIGDHIGWAHGLKKAGYATNPKYPQLLLKLIDRYNLKIFDNGDTYAIANYSLHTLSGAVVSSSSRSTYNNHSTVKTYPSSSSHHSIGNRPSTAHAQSTHTQAPALGKITYYPPKTQSINQSSNSSTSKVYSQAPVSSSSSYKTYHSPKTTPITSNNSRASTSSRSYAGSSSTESKQISTAKSYMGTSVQKVEPAKTGFSLGRKSTSKSNSKSYNSNNSVASSSRNSVKTSKSYSAPVVNNPKAKPSSSHGYHKAFQSVEYNKIKAVVYETDISMMQVATDQDVSLSKLAGYNDVKQDAVLKSGTKIYLSSKKSKAGKQFRQHKVRAGETMQDISQNYAIKLSELYDKNQMPKGTQPKEGEYINLRDKRRWTPRIRTEGFTPLYIANSSVAQQNIVSRTQSTVPKSSTSTSVGNKFAPSHSATSITHNSVSASPSSKSKTYTSSKSTGNDAEMMATLNSVMNEKPYPTHVAKGNNPTVSKSETRTSSYSKPKTYTQPIVRTEVKSETNAEVKTYPKSNNLNGNYDPNIPVAKTIPYTAPVNTVQEPARKVITHSISPSSSTSASSVVKTYSESPRVISEPVKTYESSNHISYSTESYTNSNTPPTYDAEPAKKISDFHMMDRKESDSESYWSPIKSSEEQLAAKTGQKETVPKSMIYKESAVPITVPVTSAPVTSAILPSVSETVKTESKATAQTSGSQSIVFTPVESQTIVSSPVESQIIESQTVEPTNSLTDSESGTQNLFTRDSDYSSGDIIVSHTTTRTYTSSAPTSSASENVSSEWTGQIYTPKASYVPPTVTEQSTVSAYTPATSTTTYSTYTPVTKSETVIAYTEPERTVVNNEVVSYETAPIVTEAVSSPKVSSSTSHTVVKGDTLYNISRRYGKTVAELKSLNGLSDNVIKLGQSLILN